PEVYPLSLHDALPICGCDASSRRARRDACRRGNRRGARSRGTDESRRAGGAPRRRRVHARRWRHHARRARAAGRLASRGPGARGSRVKWKWHLPRFPRVSWRVLAWAGAAMLVLIAWMTAPLALRRLRFFRVRQVEIVGIRYLDAEHVLATLRLPARASVFDDTNVLVERLRGLDGVADASVIRLPPASLK